MDDDAELGVDADGAGDEADGDVGKVLGAGLSAGGGHVVTVEHVVEGAVEGGGVDEQQRQASLYRVLDLAQHLNAAGRGGVVGVI